MSYLNSNHRLEYVNGHFEVQDRSRHCIASGDTKEEAIREYGLTLVDEYKNNFDT